jgi:hypothetical protein
MIRVNLIMWQKKMKKYEEKGTCMECLESHRSRIVCKSCDWVMCAHCWEQSAWRTKHWTPHRLKSPDHRMLSYILSPWLVKKAANLGPCNCVTGPYAANHCDRCAKGTSLLLLNDRMLIFPVITLEEMFYWCRTCRLEFSSAQDVCQTCYDDESPAHKAEHEFQRFVYRMEQTNHDDYERQVANSWRCLDCNGTGDQIHNQ